MIENDKHQIELHPDQQFYKLYKTVNEFLDSFGRENALYPTRNFVQVEAIELQKLAQIFYKEIIKPNHS